MGENIDCNKNEAAKEEDIYEGEEKKGEKGVEGRRMRRRKR